jgi:hypothetical protein
VPETGRDLTRRVAQDGHQIESGRLTPGLRTLREVADAFSLSIPELLEPPAHGESVHITRKGEYPLVSFMEGRRTTGTTWAGAALASSWSSSASARLLFLPS